MDRQVLDRTIHDWIKAVDISEGIDLELQTRATKRSRVDNHLPSPPRSLLTTSRMSTNTPKRRRTGAVIDDTTPRATLVDADSLSCASFHSQSDTSGRSSPRKQLANLAVDPEGLNVVALSSKNDRLPPSARNLLKRINEIANNHQVIDAALEGRIDDLKTAAADDESGLFLPHVFGSKADSAILRVVPKEQQTGAASRLLQDVLAAVQEAEECQNYDQDENSWNNLVHTPLLKAALSLWSQDSEMGFTPCTTGSLISRYKINGLTASKVDYCFFLDPCRRARDAVSNMGSAGQQKAQAAASAVEKLQRTSSEVTVNHTDFPALRTRPIFLSVETKRYGGDQRKAEFQLGVWLASQWKLLTQQAKTPTKHEIFTEVAPASQDEAEQDGCQTSDRITSQEEEDSLIPFLPGIVVDGHYWKLAITTYNGGKTTLWASRLFGSTDTILGTFKIIAGVGELIKWARAYGEWYNMNILGIR